MHSLLIHDRLRHHSEKSQMSQDELLSTQAAAEYLAAHVPDKDIQQWSMWLRNNRNHSRSAIYRIPSDRIGRIAVYTLEALQAFVEFETSRLVGHIKLTNKAAEIAQAFGIGSPEGTPFGRLLESAFTSLQSDGKQSYVQMTISKPLMVYALLPDQAVTLGKELLKAGKAAQRINGDRQYKGRVYEPIFDDGTNKIERLK